MGTAVTVITRLDYLTFLHHLSIQPSLHSSILQLRMTEYDHGMTLCILSLLLLPAATLGRTTESPVCQDNGCVFHYGGDAECVNVRHGNWSQIGRQYVLGTVDKEGLCHSQHGLQQDCCRCLPIRTTTTTTTTSTTTTTTPTTTTTSTTTTSPAVCTDVHGSCRAAFNGSGSCIDVRQGDLTYIDIDVDPLDGHCSTGPENCCECFKTKTEGSTSTTSTTTTTTSTTSTTMIPTTTAITTTSTTTGSPSTLIVTIGSSSTQTKSVIIPSGYICPSQVSKSNWAGTDTYGDTFSITQTGTNLLVTRTDRSSGWGMNLKIFCSKGECENLITRFVSGTTYNNGGKFDLEKMFCDSAKESWDGKSGIDSWISPDRFLGEAFVAELKSITVVIGVKLRNTHNGNYKDRSTKKFRVSIGSSETGPWTELLTQELEDSRNQEPPPVQQFKGKNTVKGRFMKFELLEYWGLGGGLNYFDIIPSGSLLAIGGYNGKGMASAEVLSTSCDFPLPETRYGHISVTTADGKSLVCGGRTSSGHTASCLQFNFQSKTWEHHSSMKNYYRYMASVSELMVRVVSELEI